MQSEKTEMLYYFQNTIELHQLQSVNVHDTAAQMHLVL